MEIFRWDDLINRHDRELFKHGTALSIGGFDGVHRGHALLCKKVRSVSNKNGLSAGIVTFDTPPRKTKTTSYVGHVSTMRLRLEQLEKNGIDFVILIDFSADFAKMSGESFLRFLTETIRMRYLVVGVDFACGYRRDTGVKQLERLSHSLGFQLDSIKKQYATELLPISSSAIRAAIVDADFSLAKTLLGYPFLFDLSGLSQNEAGIAYLDRTALVQVLPPEGCYKAYVYSIDGDKHMVHVELESEFLLVKSDDKAVSFENCTTLEFISRIN